MKRESQLKTWDDGCKALFLDDLYIKDATSLERVWHQPVKHGIPVLVPDRPWEKGSPRTRYAGGSLGQACFSVPVRDEERGVWRMWYNGGLYGLPLYAESADGVHWEKPELGLVEWEGSKRNNIYDLHGNGVLHRDFKRNDPCIVCDDNDPDPHRRYKGVMPPNLTRIVSPDGLTWRRLEGSLPADDTFHLEYDRRNRQFLITAKLNITKPQQMVSDYLLPPDYRMGRTAWLFTSRDFENWDGPVLALYPTPKAQHAAATYMTRIQSELTRRQPLIDDPEGLDKLPDWAGGDDGAGDSFQRSQRHAALFGGTEYKADIYTMPVCEYEGMYLGFPTRMITTGPYTWDWDHGDRIEQGSNGDGPQYAFLAYSRNLRDWSEQENTPFIDTSPITDEGVYDNGMVMGAVPVRNGDELWFYYVGYRFTHHQHHELAPEWYQRGGIAPEMRRCWPVGGVFLSRLRLDGFASMRAGENPGMLLTPPLTLPEGQLFVNINNPSGNLVVEVVDEQGYPLPGFAKRDCIPVATDSIRVPVRWKGGGSLAGITRKTVHFRFHFRQGDLYAFWIGV